MLVRSTRLEPPLFERVLGDPEAPLLALALHHGDSVRSDVAHLLAVDAERRRSEEDPLTGFWAEIAPNRLVALRSRFEVDLNRPPEQAIYLGPDDAWGLGVWRVPPGAELVARSLELHAHFYDVARETLQALLAHSPRVLVLDLHTYNHRRGGPGAEPDDPARNPDLNVGTGTMDRARWAPVVDAFIERALAESGGDVRENVRFFGGYFARWAHRTFPSQVCVLALEVKKTFMNEHEGWVDLGELVRWREILRAGASAALEAMEGS